MTIDDLRSAGICPFSSGNSNADDSNYDVNYDNNDYDNDVPQIYCTSRYFNVPTHGSPNTLLEA